MTRILANRTTPPPGQSAGGGIVPAYIDANKIFGFMSGIAHV